MKTLPLILLLLLPSLASAQTSRLSWTQEATWAEFQGYAYTLTVNGGPPQTLTPDCVDGVPIKCTATLPALNGPTTLVLTVRNAYGSASASLSGDQPKVPGNLTITVIVTVQGDD